MTAGDTIQWLAGGAVLLRTDMAPLHDGHDIRDERGWLTPAERETLFSLRSGVRRAAWLSGRYAAKQLIVTYCRALPQRVCHWRSEDILPRDVQIDSRDGLGRAVRPVVTIAGRTQPWSLSIAHSQRSVLAAFSPQAGASLGVDVVMIQDVRADALKWWLTDQERRFLADEETARRAGTIWSLKEAVYKAINQGERFVPRRIEIIPATDGGFGCRVDGRERGDCRLQVMGAATEVFTVVTASSRRKARIA